MSTRIVVTKTITTTITLSEGTSFLMRLDLGTVEKPNQVTVAFNASNTRFVITRTPDSVYKWSLQMINTDYGIDMEYMVGDTRKELIEYVEKLVK